MTAVVLDHEQPQEKAGGGYGDEERSPRMAQAIGEPSGGPQGDEREHRDDNLGDAAKAARIAIPVENLPKGPHVGRGTT